MSSARPTRTTARFGSWTAEMRPVTPTEGAADGGGGWSGVAYHGRRQVHLRSIRRAEVHGDWPDDGDDRLAVTGDEQAVATHVAKLKALRRRLDHGVGSRDQRPDDADIRVSSRPIVSGCPRSTRQTPSPVRTSTPQSVTARSFVVCGSRTVPRPRRRRAIAPADRAGSAAEPVDDLVRARVVHEVAVVDEVVVRHPGDLLEIGERSGANSCRCRRTTTVRGFPLPTIVR